MIENKVKRLLAEGKPAIGSWTTLASPLSAEVMAHIGFDWIVVDTEHTPVGRETVLHCFQAINTTETIPMARVVNNDLVHIKRVLDAGALGIVVPMVLDAEQAAQAVAYAKFPPEGIRSVSGARSATVYGPDYLKRANDEIVVVVQIEHIDAVRRAREILSVEGVDAGFIGPTDLAWSMGVEIGSPEHEAAIQEVLAAGKDVGRAVGIHNPDGEAARKRIEQGFQFIAIASDAAYVRAYGGQMLAQARAAQVD